MQRKLVFVSSTPGGMAAIPAYFRRIFSEEDCKLKAITHGPFGIRSDWREFVRKLDMPVQFFSKDDLTKHYPKALYKKYPKALILPAVLSITPGAVDILISAEELQALNSVDELKDLVTKKLL